jgi:phage baseplate assembly protein W
MSGFKIPLNFSNGALFENNWVTNVKHYDNINDSIKESINNFIHLLISSPNGSFVPDSEFGFSLRNCHFENTNSKDELKGKKIGGNSDNSNNYAKDFERAIKRFEPRLQNVQVKTDFEKRLSKMTLSLSGTITGTKEEYKQDLTLYIWKKNENI